MSIDVCVQLSKAIACAGVSDQGNGAYRVDFADGTSRLATAAEITAAQSAAATAAIPSVTRDRLLVALHNAGLLNGINAYVAAASDPTIALRWNAASIVDRSNPTVIAAATAAGLTSAQVDAVFQAAAQIV